VELTRTFQFRLEPTGAQHGQITRFVGACRWVWNKALEEQKRLLELGESTVSYGEMCAWLTQ
jgi:putative transposase